jgi:2-dehydro-3-deoxyphosphogluconate aldolase/(4S)-4-hydroxy-2-oxoglutarate aldolase
MTAALAARQAATRALLRRAGVLPVVTVDTEEQALEVGRALARGGLAAIELTLRSPIAMQALGALKREVPALLVGAGTVRSAAQASEAAALGVDFLVTPGTTPALAQALAALDLPVVPGAATVSEMLALLELGFDAQKFFPAVAAGGLDMLRSLAGPLPGLAFCPTGGIKESTAADFLRLPNVLCVGGSWMVAPQWIGAGDYARVEDAARRARRLIDSLPSPA